MSRIYSPDRRRGYLTPFASCQRCTELEAENHDLKLQVAALSLTLDLFRKAVLADYEWRGFIEAEEYLNELVIEQVKREAQYEYEGQWPC